MITETVCPSPLQRQQERDQLPLVVPVEEFDVIPHLRRLAAMTQDRIGQVEGCRVVHEAAARAQTPERRRPDLVARRRSAVLHDAVAGADVVQEEVAEWLDPFVPEGVRHRQRLPPDRKSTRLNSSHEWISYAVFCLKKKKIK